MKPCAIVAALAALGLMFTDPPPPGMPGPPGTQPVPPESRRLLIGDSLAVGLAPHMPHATLAKGGTTAAQWAAGKYRAPLLAMLRDRRPALVLICLGTNDTAQGRPAPKLGEHFAELARLIRDHGAEPVFLEPTELPWSRAPIVQAAAATGARVIRAPVLPSSARSRDRIHLTPEGYRLWAEHVRAALRPVENPFTAKDTAP